MRDASTCTCVRLRYTSGNILGALRPNGNGTYDVAVVGNGPLRPDERIAISRFHNIVRFNDMKSLLPGERTTLRAVRSPTAIPPANRTEAPVWAFTHHPQFLPDDARLTTWIYMPRVQGHQILRNHAASARVFDGCDECGVLCHSNQSRSGISTGTIVISELNALEEVAKIHVYGMNWAGGPHHNDFVHRHLVSMCCAKCVIQVDPPNPEHELR